MTMQYDLKCIDCDTTKDRVEDVYLTTEGTICNSCYDKRIREFQRALYSILDTHHSSWVIMDES